QRRQVQTASIQPIEGSILEWLPWNNSLPNGVVSVYNEDAGRTEYVCKYKCFTGHYNPNNKSPKKYAGAEFAILVNRDNFETLEWKDGSYGLAPNNSVRACSGEDVYVGRNEHGLGRVDIQKKLLIVSKRGSQYLCKKYQVLTVNDKIISQQIDSVRYITDESKIFNFPPEIIHKTTTSNYECHPVEKKNALFKSYQVTQWWDTDVSANIAFKTFIVPLITSFGVELFFQYSKGNRQTPSLKPSL
ncbi:natterin-4-like, partial [Xyrichtys novacula]